MQKISVCKQMKQDKILIVLAKLWRNYLKQMAWRGIFWWKRQQKKIKVGLSHHICWFVLFSTIRSIIRCRHICFPVPDEKVLGKLITSGLWNNIYYQYPSFGKCFSKKKRGKIVICRNKLLDNWYYWATLGYTFVGCFVPFVLFFVQKYKRCLKKQIQYGVYQSLLWNSWLTPKIVKSKTVDEKEKKLKKWQFGNGEKVKVIFCTCLRHQDKIDPSYFTVWDRWDEKSQSRKIWVRWNGNVLKKKTHGHPHFMMLNAW